MRLLTIVAALAFTQCSFGQVGLFNIGTSSGSGCGTSNRVGLFATMHERRLDRIDARANAHAIRHGYASSGGCQGWVAGTYQFVPFASGSGCTSSQAGTRQSGCNGGVGGTNASQPAKATGGALVAPTKKPVATVSIGSLNNENCGCLNCQCGPDCCCLHKRVAIQPPAKTIY